MEKISKRKIAMKTIEQLKNNEWTFRWNLKSESALTCTRKGMKIWCGNGGFFTDIYNLNYFGYFWRHVVWWKGVRPKKKEFEEKYKREWMEKIRKENAMKGTMENKKITVIYKNISVSFIGKYRRDLEKPNWHYYETSKGDILHMKKFEMVAVLEGDDFVVEK